jgi:NNP family nitrate/nitrite transporter-like MFS transporter
LAINLFPICREDLKTSFQREAMGMYADAPAQNDNKATRIKLLSLARPHMRTFHMTWFAFFLAFFGWFGIAPLMALVREDLNLTQTQIGNTIIASVAITIVARLVIGWLCDRIGPRLAYTGLLVLGSIPVMAIGLANSYESFLLFRLAIGVIGASFVITQYHTSVMFAPNVVGTANATTAGWGNLGGGVTQMLMPLILAAVLMFGVGETLGWRVAMVVPGVALLVIGFAYYFLTQDSPRGNYKDLRASGQMAPSSSINGSFLTAAKDYRVWALFLIYGACFGIELTINNVAALYYHDRFGLGVGAAGLIAGLFGLMNIFARTLGGLFGDRAGIKFGIKGRVMFMGFVLALEGLALILFSQMSVLFLAVGAMIVFSLFVQMSEGATYSVVPFINRKALGSVAGIVGAGGNAGAVAAGFLFRIEGFSTELALLYLGIGVTLVAPLALLVRFSARAEAEEKEAMERALADRDITETAPALLPAD